MGSISIACYKPKPGCEEALLQLVRNHLPPLRAAGLLTKRAQQTRPGRRNDRRVCPFRRAAVAACALVTERASIVMRASDGTIVEVLSGCRKKRLRRPTTIRWCWVSGKSSKQSAPTKY